MVLLLDFKLYFDNRFQLHATSSWQSGGDSYFLSETHSFWFCRIQCVRMKHFYRELNHNQIIKGLLLILASLLILAVFLSLKPFLEGQFRNKEGGRIYIDLYCNCNFQTCVNQKTNNTAFSSALCFHVIESPSILNRAQ